VLDGEDFTNVVSTEPLTAHFAPGQTPFANFVRLNTIDLNPELRVKVEVLVPNVGLPTFDIDPKDSEFLCQAKVKVYQARSYSSQEDGQGQRI